MKWNWLKLSLIGMLAYVFALVALFPAHHAYGLTRPRLPEDLALNLYNLDGSICSGHAGTLSWHGVPLGALHWELDPWQLLRGQLTARLQLHGKNTQINSHATVMLDGNVVLRDLDARLSAAQLLLLLNPGLPIAAAGTVTVRLDEVHLQPPHSPVLHGVINWNQALLVVGQPLQMGNLHLTLQADDNGGTRGALGDSGGPLEVNGSVIIDPNRVFHLSVKLRPRPGAGAALDNGLQLLGDPDGRGYYNLRYRGQL